MNQDDEIKNIVLEGLSKEMAKLKPRTEEDILKDFEKLGYTCVYNNDSGFILEKREYIYVDEKEIITRIHIHKNYKHYIKSNTILRHYDNDTWYGIRITIEENKLLHELFECWGWI